MTTVVAFALALLAAIPASRSRADDTAAPPYVGGIIYDSSNLTGDWRGARNDLAAKGITLDATVTQVEQGVVSGGKDGGWEYGGRGDLTGNLDTGKLGLWPGGFMTVELEGNWDSSVNGKTGALLPVNTNQLFPVPVGSNVGLPQLSFAQFVSPYAGITVGKFDTASGDANAFAHGKGDTQFLNLAFNFNPVTLMVTPYSTLGGGAIILPTKDPTAAIVQLLVLSSNGKATTAGFDELSGDALTFAGEGRVRTDFFSLTGHQLVGAEYSNKQFTSLDQRLGFVIENRALKPKDDSWNVYYNFDQFLYETDHAAGRGIGLFGRFGASDGNPNPVHYFFSFGVGGTGLMNIRPYDQFGLGYYYTIVSNPTLQMPFVSNTKDFLRDEWGFEGYYNVALTRWLLLTPDVQVIGPSQKQEIIALNRRQSVGTATVLGLRAQIVF